MGFSLSSFLGGAAGAGSRGIEKRRDTLQREKETAEARQWQIATESRADSRNKKKERAVAKREAEERADSLALYFNPDQVKDIMGGGKAQIQYALDYASKLPTDQDASLNYKTTSQLAEIPPISGGPRGRVSPFSSRFKTTAAALEKYEGGFGEMLAINARNVLKFQGNETKLAELSAERVTIEASVKSYEAAKAKAEPDADTTDIFSGRQGKTSMETIFRQTEGQALETADLAEWDRTNAKYVLKAGSTGEIQSAILKNLQGLQLSYADHSPSMLTKINFGREEAIKSLRAFGASVVENAPASMKKYSTIAEFQNAANNNAILPGAVIDVANGAKFFVYTGQPTVPNAKNGLMQTFFELN